MYARWDINAEYGFPAFIDQPYYLRIRALHIPRKACAEDGIHNGITVSYLHPHGID